MRTIKVDDETHKRIKIEAAKQGLNMIQTIKKAIDVFSAQTTDKTAKRSG